MSDEEAFEAALVALGRWENALDDLQSEPDRFGCQTLRGRYDDDRSLTVEASQFGEVIVRVGNQEPLFFGAADLMLAVFRAADLAIEALPKGP